MFCRLWFGLFLWPNSEKNGQSWHGKWANWQNLYLRMEVNKKCGLKPHTEMVIAVFSILPKKNLLAPRLGRGRAESQKIWGGRGNARERGAGSGFHVGKVLRAVHILHSLPWHPKLEQQAWVAFWLLSYFLIFLLKILFILQLKEIICLFSISVKCKTTKKPKEKSV